MRLSFRTIAIALLCLLWWAPYAHAWGPATHVGLGASLLEQLSLLPAALALILSRQKRAYLYGSIAADVVFAKRLSRIKQACHHWSTAFQLLSSARDEQDQAFAYGYLSHLAADTVAHGKYVPRQILVSGCTVTFGHPFWEIRADHLEDDGTWRLLDSVLGGDNTAHHEQLSNHIRDTLLPYELNRRLFDRINATNARTRFRRAVTTWNRCSRWYLSPALVAGYRGECLDRIHAILRQGSRSALLREDPNGTSALMQLRVRRRDVRWRRIRRLPVDAWLHETAHALAPHGGASKTPDALPGQASLQK